MSVEERRQAEVQADAALRAAKLAAVDSLLWDTDFLQQDMGSGLPGRTSAAGESRMRSTVCGTCMDEAGIDAAHVLAWQAPGRKQRSWASCTGRWRWACAAARCW